MAELFVVPEVAAGATEVLIAEWLVEPGQAIKAGAPIAVIETEKAIVEVEADNDATLLRTLVSPGTTVEVGSPMALFGSEAEATGDIDALLAELGVSSDIGVRTASLREVAASEAESPAPGQDPAPQHQPHAPAGQHVVDPSTAIGNAGGRVFVSPIARKLLKEAGLTPEGIEGSGAHGRIRRRDVTAIIAASTAQTGQSPRGTQATSPVTTEAAPDAADRWTDVPHPRLRQAVARRLTQSKQQVPHFYVRRTAVLDELLTLRSQVNEAAPARVSVNDFMIKAIAVAHVRVPDANVIWTADALRKFAGVDIGVAIASTRGLVTPVLRNVEHSSLVQISAQVKSFASQANEGKLSQSDLEGGSISISNLGMYGVEEFSAIINPPHSAILAVGAGRPVPIAEGRKVKNRTAAELVLSVDHRAIDGALAAQWMAALVDALHHPIQLLL